MWLPECLFSLQKSSRQEIDVTRLVPALPRLTLAKWSEKILCVSSEKMADLGGQFSSAAGKDSLIDFYLPHSA